MSKKHKSMDEVMDEVGPGDITPSVDAGEADFLARHATEMDMASVAPLEVVTSAAVPAEAQPTDVEVAIASAALLVDALADRCSYGGRADLGDLRQLERNIRALASL